MSPNQHTLSLSFFPRAGADGQWTTPVGQERKNHSVCSLPRYRLVPENVLCRSKKCKETNLPIFQDSETPNPFHDISQSGEKVKGHLCLDDLEVGIGCCSLQVTFQAPNQADARWLHDQLIPLAPIMLAMTAAVPIWKGYLVDHDVRWQRFGDLLDDRREEEMKTTVSGNHPGVEYSFELTLRSLPAGLGTEPTSHLKGHRALTAALHNHWTRQSNNAC